jgi:quercetin dioxygenase-like cupin family protein
MTLINLKDLEEKEVVPGYRARFVHTEAMTLAYWTIRAGAPLPEHTHPHEQVTTLLEGEFEFTLSGETHRLKPGKVVVIPSSVSHSGRAISDCRILDVFYPVREEYR